jgi:hypothetical protein
MTLQQLADMKRWHVLHRRDHPVEGWAWDLVLTVSLVGWFGAPAALIVDRPGVFAGCVLVSFAPSAYVALRQRLHRRGVLRCDWVGAMPRSG